MLEEEGSVGVGAGLQVHQLALVEAEAGAQVRLDAHHAQRRPRYRRRALLTTAAQLETASRTHIDG